MTSPFLPGTNIQFAWDSTSLGWFKECPRKYYYSMIKGYRPRGESVHLTFGIWYHSALELYDRGRAEGHDHEKALYGVVSSILEWTWIDGAPWVSDHNTKTRENLVRTVIWYLDQFENDPAKTVILANGKPAVELSFKMELDFGPRPYDAGDGKVTVPSSYLLCGHIDRLVEFNGATFGLDRKTSGSTIGTYYFDKYSPDNQISLYTIATKIIYQIPISGFIIDAAQIAVGFSRFGRGFAYRTPDQIEEWLDDLRYTLRQAEACAVEDRWPMNDKSCHNYGGCPFRKVCSKSPAVRETFLESDFTKRPWNPLEPR